jgi:hypothetical protein
MSKKQLAEEYPPPSEAQAIQNLTQRLLKKIVDENPTGIMRRDAHTKMHGIVKAEFIIEPNLPEQLRVGLFKQPGSYQAWIRFSNQNLMAPDSKKDIRGMAIKVLGVPGPKLLKNEEDSPNHDFILISTNTFVTKDVQEFDAMIKAIVCGKLAAAFFFLTHWRVSWNLLKSMKVIANPLKIPYFSPTPYRFGKHAVKYSAKPYFDQPDAVPNNPDYYFLRQAMVNQLATQEVTFDFSVQLQTNADTMPIEDPGVAWSESESPFCKVASIKIPRQEFDSEKQREFGENISFNPARCLAEHKPIGGINRARMVVYQAISIFRHKQNQVLVKEPSGWDI